MALEGFSEDDAAQILDCRPADAARLVEESGRELAAEIATDVLIIEDETFIAMDIEALVESLGHRVIGVARTHSEAVALARQKRPGLILADIQLADGSSGLDAVNELLGSFEVPVIFITAYPERFLTGAAAGAGLPDRQAVPARGRLGGRQSGAVLRAQGAAARAAGDGVSHPNFFLSVAAGHPRPLFRRFCLMTHIHHQLHSSLLLDDEFGSLARPARTY